MTTLSDLRDNSTDIDDGSGQNIVATINWTEDPMTGACQPVITWNEYMKFHSQRLAFCESFGDPDTLPERVQAVLEGIFGGGDFQTYTQWSDCDDLDGFPFLEIEITPVLNSAWTDDADAVEGLLWPAIATMINITDPGTFNSPYLFSDVVVTA